MSDSISTPATRAMLEAVEAAAVAALDPLAFDAQPERHASDPLAWRAPLRDRVAAFAMQSREAGLSGLSYAAELVAAVLSASIGGKAGPDRAMAEQWTSALVAFCAGQDDSQFVDDWIDGLRRWPGLARRLTARVANRLATRLAGDAISLHAWREAIDSPSGENPALEIASDELELIAAALDEIDAECASAMREWVGGVEESARERAIDCMALYAERVGHLGNALGFLGLSALGEGFALLAARLEADAREVPRAGDARIPALGQWALQWALAFRSPGGPEFARAIAVHAQLVTLSDPARDRISAQWHAMRPIASRQISAHAVSDADVPLQLGLADDTDPQVVDQLLRELPALADVLASCIDGFAQGNVGLIEPARRAAHTLKGAANTAGIEGIARMTHGLEDLLSLLERSGGETEPGLLRLLGETSDTLAAMVDSVAGRGPQPSAMQAVYRRLLEELAARTGTDTGGVDTRGAPADPGPERVDVAASRVEPAAGSQSPLEPQANPPARSPADAPDGGVDGTSLRVSEKLIDTLVDASTDSTIAITRLQARLESLAGIRRAIRQSAQRIRDLAQEVARLGAARAAPAGDAGNLRAGAGGFEGFDPLEMHRYDDVDRLAGRIAEVGADTQLLESELGAQLEGLVELSARLDRSQTEIRDSSLRARMIPVDSIVTRLERAARQAARMAGRSVVLQVDGRGQNFEARLLQALVEPLGHLIRNAVDHGIEDPAVRIEAGKPATGSIRISFERVGGGALRVSCRDDGRGPDLARVRERAAAMGMDPAVLDEPDGLARVLCTSEFSTRAHASQLSGRGLGMELVAHAVANLHGRIELRAEPGSGLIVELTVPLELASVGALVVRSASHALALSVGAIASIVPAIGIRAHPGQQATIDINARALPLARLDDLLGMNPGSLVAERDEQGEPDVVLLIDSPLTEIAAVLVPSPGAARQLIAQPLPAFMPPIPGIEAATVLGDGAVAPIIDLRAWLAARGSHAKPVLPPRREPDRPRCLVVDDSVSVRRAMRGLVEDLGILVDSAADGIEAIELIELHTPSIAIIDLEMPRMNGIELTRALRERVETAAIPVIMITSRDSPRHRDEAMAAGVTHFLGKPYAQDDLAALIHQSLRAP